MAINISSDYDYEFVDKVPEDFICPICHSAMKNPVLTKCGHQFCKECLEKTYKRDPKCPVDREPLTPKDIFPDKNTERKILSLKIKCPNQECDWQGDLGNFESRHDTCCDYKVVDCDNTRCSVRKPRREMVKHVQECQYRMVACSYCENIYTLSEMEEHKNQCPKFAVSCPNDCGKTLKREQIASHLSDECPLTIVPCSYQSIGCDIEVQRKYFNDHIENHMKQHLEIAVKKIASLEEKMDGMNTKATLASELFQKQINEMKGQSEKQINEMNKRMEKLSDELDEIKWVTTSTDERRPSQTDEKKREVNPCTSVMTWSQIEGRYSYICELKADQEGASGPLGLFSDPFYLCKKGYKFQVQWFIDTATLYLLPGEYDSNLNWPLKLKALQIILLNQSSSRQNIILIDRDYPRILRWKKLESLEVSKPKVGCSVALEASDTIVPYSKLEKENYLMNKALFLKVQLS